MDKKEIEQLALMLSDDAETMEASYGQPSSSAIVANIRKAVTFLDTLFTVAEHHCTGCGQDWSGQPTISFDCPTCGASEVSGK